jgi:hypothetical protein
MVQIWEERVLLTPQDASDAMIQSTDTLMVSPGWRNPFASTLCMAKIFSVRFIGRRPGGLVSTGKRGVLARSAEFRASSPGNIDVSQNIRGVSGMLTGSQQEHDFGCVCLGRRTVFSQPETSMVNRGLANASDILKHFCLPAMTRRPQTCSGYLV